MVESDTGCLLYAGDKLVPQKSARPELLKIAYMIHLGEEIVWNNMKKKKKYSNWEMGHSRVITGVNTEQWGISQQV